MPNFISNGGKLYAAKEIVGLTNKSDKAFEYEGKMIQPGEPFIYKGPDREAIKVLNEQGVEHLGADFKRDPEFRQSVRNQGFESIEQFLDAMGYDEEKQKKEFEKKIEKVRSHDMPKKVREITILAGGRDLSGQKANDMVGGFGSERERPASELKKK